MSDKTLDCSDLDQHMGKPIAPAKMKEPLHNNDFRRWAQAMHYPNLLHYEHDYAKAGRYGRLIAPQSFPVATDDGHGAAPACVGKIAGGGTQRDHRSGETRVDGRRSGDDCSPWQEHRARFCAGPVPV